MRWSSVCVAVLATASCGHKHARTGRLIATLSPADYGGDITPVAIQAQGGVLFVTLAHDMDASPPHQASYTLLRIDSHTGAVTEIAHDLPSGRVAAGPDGIYEIEFYGKLGSVDPKTGAYRQLTDLGESADSIAVTSSGFLIGAKGHVLLVDPTGVKREVSGINVAASESLEVVDTPAGVFGVALSSGSILRIDKDHSIILADHQREPGALAATTTQVAWAVADEQGHHRHRIMTIPAKGGASSVLCDLPADTLVRDMTSTDHGFAYTQVSASDDNKSNAIYAIGAGGGTPVRVAVVNTAEATLASDGGTIYWIEHVPGKGEAIKSAPAP